MGVSQQSVSIWYCISLLYFVAQLWCNPIYGLRESAWWDFDAKIGAFSHDDIVGVYMPRGIDVRRREGMIICPQMFCMLLFHIVCHHASERRPSCAHCTSQQLSIPGIERVSACAAHSAKSTCARIISSSFISYLLILSIFYLEQGKLSFMCGVRKADETVHPSNLWAKSTTR